MNNTLYHKTFLALAACAALSAPLAARAQDVTITPDQAVRDALDRNPSLKSAAIDIERARISVEREDHRFRPNYRVEAGLQTGSTPSLGRDGTVTGIARDTLSGTAAIDQQFATGTTLTGSVSFDRRIQDSTVFGNQGATYGVDARLDVSQPWLRGAGDKILDASYYRARYDVDASNQSRDREASALVKETLDAYWELWYAQRAVTLRKAALDLARAELAQGQLRVDAGTIAETDLLPLRTEIASLAESLSAASASVRTRSIALSRLLDGTGANEHLTVSDQAPATRAVPDLDTVVELAEAQSLDLARLQVAVETRKLDVLLADDNEQVQLDTFAWLQVSGLGLDAGSVAGSFGSFDGVSGYVGIRLSGPFDGTYNDAESRRARMAVGSAELDLEAERERLRASVRQQLTILDAAVERLDLAEQTLTLARASTEAEQRRFAAGTTTALDVVAVLQRQNEAELRVARARVDILLAHVAIDDLSGQLLARADLRSPPASQP